MDNLSFELQAGEATNKPEKNGAQNMPVKVEGSSPKTPLTKSVLGKLLILAVCFLVVACIVLVVLLVIEKGESNEPRKSNVKSGAVAYSGEAKRFGLVEFLKKVRIVYREYNRHKLSLQDYETTEEFDVMGRHAPYNATPEYLKSRTDACFALLNELEDKNVDENKLEPRELKLVEQVKHFLKTMFNQPYGENFYMADWMLGPNAFCWQPICSIASNIASHAQMVPTPENLEEFRKVLDKISLNKVAILQYKSNIQFGVKAGMVWPKHVCEPGIDYFKQTFKLISKDSNDTNVLEEWFVQGYRTRLTRKLTTEDKETWIHQNGKNVSSSLDDYLVEGIGKPLVELLEYLDKDYRRNCLPAHLTSGLEGLPVDYVYIDGNATSQRTTKMLPLTKTRINGSECYQNILRFFTTSDISADEINRIGIRRLNELYPQVVAIAKNVTGESNETTAVNEFREILKERKQFYNANPFPQNESNSTAHKDCDSLAKAKKNCPKRWEAFEIWSSVVRDAMGMLSPKLIPLFYHTGVKITVPNCPIKISPNFHPSAGVQAFSGSGPDCSIPTNFYLPFFGENFGPRFSEWSVVAHEAWPGHHTQIQGQAEYFSGNQDEISTWLNKKIFNIFFAEGWGLYAENPVIAEDTDTYHNEPMQKFGMLKWQVWRALRLIVDTGLHHRGMTRSEALGYFSKYAWDESDIAEKEVTRYQSIAGQATSYMLGQEKIIELRKYAETKLRSQFNLKDFHYQILSQGSGTAAYLTKHIEKYVKCTLGKLDGDVCDVLLNPAEKTSLQTKFEQQLTTNHDMANPYHIYYL